MLFSLLYMVLRVIFRLAPSGDERDHEVEILVLRHQVKFSSAKLAAPSSHVVPCMQADAAAAVDALLAKKVLRQRRCP